MKNISTTRRRPALKTARAAGVTARACRREETADKRGHVAPAGGKQGGVASRPTVQVPQPTLTERQPHEPGRNGRIDRAGIGRCFVAVRHHQNPHCQSSRSCRGLRTTGRGRGPLAPAETDASACSCCLLRSAARAASTLARRTCRLTPLLTAAHIRSLRGVVLSIRATLNRYGFSSCRWPGGAGVGRVGLQNHQLWPDFMPVIGPQIAAGDGAIGRALDRYATFDRHRPDTGAPLADRGSRNTQQAGHLGDATHQITSAFDFNHARMIRHCLAKIKALPQLSQFVRVGYA